MDFRLHGHISKAATGDWRIYSPNATGVSNILYRSFRYKFSTTTGVLIILYRSWSYIITDNPLNRCESWEHKLLILLFLKLRNITTVAGVAILRKWRINWK